MDLEQVDAGVESAALWLRPDVIASYPNGRYLRAVRGRRWVGLWHVPLDDDGHAVHARRAVRLLPYAAPWLAAAHPSRRREVMVQLLRALQSAVVSIDLPLAPGFEDTNASIDVGIFVEQRHTHVVDLRADYRTAYNSALRNHLASARRTTALEVSKGPERFRFERAIVHQPPEAVRMRARFAETLERGVAVRCLTLRQAGWCVGQGLVVASGSTAYYLHSWFERSGPRGVPSRLLDEAMHTAATSLGSTSFDFEGSVIPSVDRFMSSFGARRVPYGHLLWHRDRGEMGSLLLSTVSRSATSQPTLPSLLSDGAA